uniref:Olfactory receptor 92 n=1 Tax=Meteorus pulchricornis TaxID=51522 RepID=A0A1S5VFT2_9HYME|nr:olfactory receptor 92 [Meteorus pulchricornis]
MSSVSHSIFLLRSFGMWYCDDWLTGWKAKLYIVYTVFIFFVVYSFTLSHLLMLYAFINDAREFADASFVLLTCIATCGKMFNMISKRKTIGALLRTVQEGLFRPRDSEEFAINDESIHRTRLYTCLAGVLAELSCTLLTVLSLARDFPRRELTHEAWLPFSTATPVAYTIAFLHQIYARYIVASINIGFDCLIPGIMIITSTQLAIFKHRVRKIHDVVEHARNSYNDTFHLKDKVYMEQKLIGSCVEHHCAIFQ